MTSSRFAGRAIAAAALCVLAVTLAAVTASDAAPIDSANASCRKAITKGVSKLGSTVMKAFDGCIKTGLKNGVGDCATAALSDQKNKIPGAAAKLSAGIAADCSDAGTTVALAEHANCGQPLGTAIATFTDVDACLNQLTPISVEDLRGAILAPDYVNANDVAADCANAIAKNASKLFKTVQKETSKVIAANDNDGLDSDYNDPGDPDGKIAAAATKAGDGILAKCSLLTPAEWSMVRSCAEDATSVRDCVLAKVMTTAEGLTASGYDQPGICYSSLVLTVHGGAQGGAVVSKTELDMGWTGLGHDLELTGQWDLPFDVTCSPFGGNNCGSCVGAPTCADGQCRCSNDESVVCNQPYNNDFVDCGGNVCQMHFGPPQPIYAGGNSVCAVNLVAGDIAAESLALVQSLELVVLNMTLRTKLYLGPSVEKPCPSCDAGVCNGGQRNGLACTIDATYELGNTSRDCPPSAINNVTGSGLRQTLFPMESDPQSNPFGLACDAPLGALSCPCSVCSGDFSLPCEADFQCIGFGTCLTAGGHGGAPRAPNGCGAGNCVDVGGEEGECDSVIDTYCDGVTRGNGAGIYSCIDNNDCEPAITGTGFCTIAKPRPCFLDPIDTGGSYNGQGVVLADEYCLPPSGNTGINYALGLPGPARVTLDTEITPYCSDGVTVWQQGGANCP